LKTGLLPLVTLLVTAVVLQVYLRRRSPVST
jgi:hypothetical protein